MILVRNKRDIFKTKYRYLACFDKDGTLVKDTGYVHKLSDFQWHSKGLNLLRKATLQNAAIVVITNQSGISKRIFTKRQAILFAKLLIKKARHEKINIRLVIICPHGDQDVDNNCNCRKPSPGMYFKIKKFRWAKNLDSIMIGNTLTDENFAKRLEITYLDVNNHKSIKLLETWEMSKL